MGTLTDDVHGEELVVLAELHAGDARGGTSQGPHGLVARREADRLALARDEDEVVGRVDEARRDELVRVAVGVLAQVDRDDTAAAVRVVLGQPGLLHGPAAGREHEVVRDVVVAHVEDLRDLLPGLEGQEVGDVLALRVTAALGQLVGLGAVDTAEIREEEQPVVRGRDEEVVDDVVLAQLGATHSLAATLLRTVVVAARPLGVAAAGDGDDHLLLGDEVFHRDLAGVREDRRATLVAVLRDELVHLVGDDLTLARLLREDVLVLQDLLLELVVLVDDLLALQGGEAAQLHVEDRGRLDLVDVEHLDEALTRTVGVGGAADERDDVVETVERLEVPAEDVDLRLGLAQQEGRATHDDLELVGDPVADERVDAQRAGHAVDEREHVRTEVVLQLRVLVQVVEHDLRDGVALEHDHQALARAARRLVADVRDPLDAPVLDQLGDLQREGVGVDLVRELGDDEADPVLDLLDVDDRAHRDRAAARAVRVLDPAVAEDRRACREVRALDDADQRVEDLFGRGVRVVEVPLDALGDLAEVVRRDVGGHADGDARRAVD